MLIKVCGMKESDQIQELDERVDYLGFIFYEKSKRIVVSTPKVTQAKKVGVFVDASESEIRSTMEIHSLDAVQLHGNETAELCASLRKDIEVIKAFGIDQLFNFSKTDIYSDQVDYFLFDTKTVQHGGSGRKFDWSLLSNYKGSAPFLLSGGINPDSLESITSFSHPKFAGIDLNSGFEIEPGNKNTQEIIDFIKELEQ